MTPNIIAHIPFHSTPLHFNFYKQTRKSLPIHSFIHSFNCAAEVIHPQLTKKSNSFCLLSTSIVIFAPSRLPIPFLRLTLLPLSLSLAALLNNRALNRHVMSRHQMQQLRPISFPSLPYAAQSLLLRRQHLHAVHLLHVQQNRPTFLRFSVSTLVWRAPRSDPRLRASARRRAAPSAETGSVRAA